MFRLAERLGMTVARLGVEMDSAEFSAWHAYDARETRLREEEEKARESQSEPTEPIEDAG